MIYKEREFVIVKTDKDGREFFIPKEKSNSDYQAYLVWLEDPKATQSTPSVE
jgi:hypothetical protein